jgi:hypothetical protein
MSIFPPIPSVKAGATAVEGTEDWIFKRFTLKPLSSPAAVNITVSQEHPPGPNATSLKGADEATWNDAAVYSLRIPSSAANRHVNLNIHYIGDAARLYIGDELYDDNFFNGGPFPIALWRIPAAQWPNIRLKILPYSNALDARLPDDTKAAVAAAKAASTIDKVTITATDQLEVSVTP